MEISKQSLIIIKNLLEDYSKNNGITPLAVQSILNFVYRKDFSKMTESEAAILLASMKDSKILKYNLEVLKFSIEIESIWVTRVRESGSNIKVLQNKILH